MPNTIAHMGIQALITRRLVLSADLGWIWLGSLLPDLPWIMQRVVKATAIDVSPIDLRLFAVVQSSLLFSLVAAAAFAALAQRPARVFIILALGCTLHLLLDATETKWGNGVLLFAPFDWRPLNLELYWPEAWPTHLLTFFGAAYVGWAILRIRPGHFHLPRPFGLKAATAVFLLLVYAFGPISLISAAERANLHYAATLRDSDGRIGKDVEFDRAKIVQGDKGPPKLANWSGETMDLTGLPIPQSAEKVSVRGRFVDTQLIEVVELYSHKGGRRDVVTIVGLGLIVMWWCWSGFRGLPSRSCTESRSREEETG